MTSRHRPSTKPGVSLAGRSEVALRSVTRNLHREQNRQARPQYLEILRRTFTGEATCQQSD